MVPKLIFQLCGLQSFASGGARPLQSALSLLWCTGNIVLYGGVLAYCLIERRWLFADERSTGLNFIPFIKSSITIVAHLSVLLEALFARNAYRALELHLSAIDRGLRKLTDATVDELHLADRHYRNKLLLFVLFCGLTELGILAMVHGNTQHQAIWCLTAPSLLIIRIKHLHHTYHIDRLSARFELLGRQLTRLLERQPSDKDTVPQDVKDDSTPRARARGHSIWPMVNTGPRSRWYDMHVLHETENVSRMFRIKGTYLALWQAVLALNDCCVHSQLANLLQNFIQCTCDLYSMYSLLYLNQFGDIFGYILSVIATFTALGIVLAACENCKDQVSQMGQLLHKRNGDEEDWLTKLIENFSLLLQHTPVYFSLGGFFDMDFVLLKEMVAAITTYMVIFIQFMPKTEVGAQESTFAGNVTSSTAQPVA
ncbi:putative gustatory receptor 2a [Anopheles aquasalis]|uniref:putative gustatory receptor 2a n=1 Tax=Anopheles aquasalis TaxID=42839 RepID=UPI00215B1C3E|nr:putative gustatory receptor 2a [Anopheles aquasalis]